MLELKDGDTVFKVLDCRDNTIKELLRITTDGFYINGKKVKDRYKIYLRFHKWMTEMEKKRQEHMKDSLVPDNTYNMGESLNVCEHKWSLHPPGGIGKQVCSICGVERA